MQYCAILLQFWDSDTNIGQSCNNHSKEFADQQSAARMLGAERARVALLTIVPSSAHIYGHSFQTKGESGTNLELKTCVNFIYGTPKMEHLICEPAQ
jgi:hypothetical protein